MKIIKIKQRFFGVVQKYQEVQILKQRQKELKQWIKMMLMIVNLNTMYLKK